MKLLIWILDKISLRRWCKYCDSFAKRGTDALTMKLYSKWSRIHRLTIEMENRYYARKSHK